MKAVILALFMEGGLGGVYLLPQVGLVAQSAVNMDLPDHSGSWTFQNQPPTEAEIGTLAKDTEFAKALCYRERPGGLNAYGNPSYDQMQLSIVLSGSDINNSIHRPERCMPAQGHQITDSSSRILKLPNGREFPTRRLVSIKTSPDPRGGDRGIQSNCLTYYFFVGHDRVSNNHYGRTFYDMKDRVMHGVDQRWAYVSVSMQYGKIPGETGEGVSESETDANVVKFLTDFSEKQINWAQITH
jgi:hypothetical protein